ncbi:MAG: hypothetical protein K2X82_08455 [Gemmataceae bacterium]|nr:hypothetical protein [Gemmataceae bacterium]
MKSLSAACAAAATAAQGGDRDDYLKAVAAACHFGYSGAKADEAKDPTAEDDLADEQGAVSPLTQAECDDLADRLKRGQERAADQEHRASVAAGEKPLPADRLRPEVVRAGNAFLVALLCANKKD